MQKLFTASQIKAWDNYTIANEPISSLNLMERASNAFVNWFVKQYTATQHIYIFCGPGNNGGDGLAICRLLQAKGYQITPYLINPKNKLSLDCTKNLNRLTEVIQYPDIKEIKLPEINKNDIIIDALFGSGLSRPLTGIYATLVQQLNAYDCIKIAIDIPSGMYSDILNNSDDIIFKANTILSFQTPKRSFFFFENNPVINHLKTLDIGLSIDYLKDTNCNWYVINSYSEIPDFDTYANIILSIEKFEHQYKVKFNSQGSIRLLAKKAREQLLIFIIKDNNNNNNTYIITPENDVYFILD